jgi:fibronectin type 3 domain-containing protein
MATASLLRPRRTLSALLAGVVVATTALAGALVAPVAPAQAANPVVAPQEDPLPERIPPTAPQNVRVATFADGGVLVEWDPPADWGNGGNRSYSVSWQGSDSESAVPRIVFAPEAFQVGVTYQIVVSTYTDRGFTSAAPVPYTRTGRPQAPTSVTAVPAGPGTVAISWVAPVNTGGLPLTRYDAFQRAVGSGSWIPGPSGIAPSASSAFATGLTIGVEYEFMVVASNAIGEGPESGTASVVVIDVPRRPTIQSVTVGDGRVDLTWDASLGVDSYEIELNDGSGFSVVPATISGTSATVTGLTNGQQYEIRVGAVNAAGRSASDDVPVWPLAAEAPGAPQALQATQAGPERVLLQWQPPVSDGRSPIMTYVVERHGQMQPWLLLGETADTSLEVAQDAGTFVEYRVSAVNAVGQGVTSDITSIALVRAPAAAPQGLVATRGDGTVSLAWSRVASTGSAPVDGYVVEQRTPGGEWAAPSSVAIDGTTARITGLVNGTALELRVLAVNAGGPGPASAVVTATPATVPGVPLALTASIDGPERVQLQWQPPASDGGSAIEQYVVEGRETPQSPWSIWTFTAATSTTLEQSAGSAREYRVFASNAVGTGVPTSAVAITAIEPPAAPQDVVATAGDGSVTLTWSAVTSSAAAPVEGYVVEQRVGDGEWDEPAAIAVDGTSARITGLANGAAIELRVIAVNAVGRSTPSATVAATPVTVPRAPTAFEVRIAGEDAVQVRWEAPASDGGSPILDYVLERRPVGGEWEQLSGYPAGATIGLPQPAGTLVEYRVSARNAVGVGTPTDVVSITALRGPVAPQGVVAVSGDGSATLSWTPVAPTDAAPVTGYRVEQRIAGGFWGTPASIVFDGTSATIAGLTNGIEVEFRVRAENELGGDWSPLVAVTPATVPDAPTALAAIGSDGTIALSWVAPADDGGADVERYLVEIRAEGTEGWTSVPADAVDGTTAVVSGLVNGQAYELRVSAVNAAGAGSATAVVTAVPSTVPDAPTGLAAMPGDEQATLTWTAPASMGGAAIDGYVVERLVDGEWVAVDVTVDGTTAVVRGLENGVVATFRVAAVNSAGTGARSATAEVAPFTIADAPTGLAGVASDGRVELSWQAPASSGGREVVGYVVEQRVDGGEWTAATSTTSTSTATSATVTGLPNGAEVELRVAAVTEDAGTGAFSAPVAATPFAFAPAVVGPTGAALAGSTVRAGDVVTITANGLPVGARVVVELRSEPVELASVLIGADGELRVQARIPADAALGAHDLVVLLTGEDLVFAPSVTAFAIEAAPVASAPTAPAAPAPAASAPAPVASAQAGSPTGGAANLPRTGADALLPMLLLAFALLGAGVAVRRRTAVRAR